LAAREDGKDRLDAFLATVLDADRAPVGRLLLYDKTFQWIGRKRISMPPLPSDFRDTRLWRHAFNTPRPDCSTEEQEFLRNQYMLLRERAAELVDEI
jgi:hypothetical protein